MKSKTLTTKWETYKLYFTLKDRPVGNIFRYGLIKLRVVQRSYTCQGCFFEQDDCGNKLLNYITGNCIASDRIDGINTKFEVEQV